MRHLLAAVLFLWAAPVWAQEFSTEAAKAAQAAYEVDLQAAKEKYAAALDNAAKQAVEAGDLEEVVRIKEMKDALGEADPIEATRKAVAGATYLFRRDDGRTYERSFLPNGKVRYKEGSKVIEEEGVWEVVEPATIIYRLTAGSGNWFFLKFSENFQKAQMARATQISSAVSTVTRVARKRTDGK